MNALNAILPIALVVAALFALWFALSRPVSLLPRWVRHAYLLLSAGMGAWAVVSFVKAHHQSSLSQRAYSLIQARGWLAGFSIGILIVLMLSGAFPKIFGRSHDGEPPVT